MIKVMIADDQELMRESLQILLSTKEDIEICALAKDGEEVLALVAKEQPDERCAVYKTDQGNVSEDRGHRFDDL